jgi:hypothetical protein
MVVVFGRVLADTGYGLVKSVGSGPPTAGAFSLLTQNRSTFLARDGRDAAYLALALCQTHLEFRATGSSARSLSLDNGLRCSN